MYILFKSCFEAFSFHVKPEEDLNANTFSRQICAVAPFKVILEVKTTSVYRNKFQSNCYYFLCINIVINLSMSLSLCVTITELKI